MLSVIFFELIGLSQSFLGKRVWITIFCQRLFQDKSSQFNCNSNHHRRAFNLDTILLCSKGSLSALPTVIHRSLEGHVLKSQNLIKLLTLLLIKDILKWNWLTSSFSQWLHGSENYNDYQCNLGPWY